MKYLLLTVFLFVVGCAAANKFSDAGEKLYAEKCSGCHRLYSREEFTADQWKTRLEEMSRKAKLSGEEKKILQRYMAEGNNL